MRPDALRPPGFTDKPACFSPKNRRTNVNMKSAPRYFQGVRPLISPKATSPPRQRTVKRGYVAPPKIDAQPKILDFASLNHGKDLKKRGSKLDPLEFQKRGGFTPPIKFNFPIAFAIENAD